MEDFLGADFEIGDVDDSGHIAQEDFNSCAIASQRMILEEYGEYVTEDALTDIALENDWYNPDFGTSPNDVGNLLEYYDIDTHHGVGVSNMMIELIKGNKVIVGVDSGELHGLDHVLEDYIEGERADHAIVVKGLTENAQGETVVIINDPGYPDGAGIEVPLERFEDAFADGGYHYIATDNPPTGFVNGIMDTIDESLSSSQISSFARTAARTIARMV